MEHRHDIVGGNGRMLVSELVLVGFSNFAINALCVVGNGRLGSLLD
jgi:hypothetical protein